MVDINKIRIGDKITVVMKVTTSDAKQSALYPIYARNGDGSCRGWIRPEDIISHDPAPRPIVVDDKIRVKYTYKIATVKAIDVKTQHAWIQWPNGQYGTWHLDELELCEEDA